MTLEELIEREKKNCKYIQTDNNHLHWFLERDLTEWVQKDKPQWVIFMPATLIASIYGMNFKFMPELDWTLTLGNGWNIPLGYIFAIGLMIFCSALTIWYFKYKKWL